MVIISKQAISAEEYSNRPERLVMPHAAKCPHIVLMEKSKMEKIRETLDRVLLSIDVLELLSHPYKYRL